MFQTPQVCSSSLREFKPFFKDAATRKKEDFFKRELELDLSSRSSSLNEKFKFRSSSIFSTTTGFSSDFQDAQVGREPLTKTKKVDEKIKKISRELRDLERKELEHSMVFYSL